MLSRYTGLTGRPALPPPFAFGPWISSDIWRDGGEVNYAVTKFRERGIPVSGFVFDSPWEIAYNDFKFNIPAPPFTTRTQKTPSSATPGLSRGSISGVRQPHRDDDILPRERAEGHLLDDPVRRTIDFEQRGSAGPEPGRGQAETGRKTASSSVSSKDGPPLVVPWWKGKGSPIDFTSKEARDWLSQRLTDLLIASMVDTTYRARRPAIGGFKTDDGEVRTTGRNHNPPAYIPETAVYSDGRTGKEFVNGYCLEYHKTVYSVLGDEGPDLRPQRVHGNPGLPWLLGRRQPAELWRPRTGCRA